MQHFEIFPIFSFPIYTSNVNSIYNEELNYIKNLDFDSSPDGQNWSKNKCILDEFILSRLKKMIDEHVENFTKNVLHVSNKIEFYLTNSWVVKNNPGASGNDHLHNNSIISGVLYLDVCENSGNLIFNRYGFVSPIFPTSVDLDFDEYNMLNTKDFVVSPKNGDVVLFPSQMIHRSLPNASKNERYCLSFNYFVRGEIGKQHKLKLF